MLLLSAARWISVYSIEFRCLSLSYFMYKGFVSQLCFLGNIKLCCYHVQPSQVSLELPHNRSSQILIPGQNHAGSYFGKTAHNLIVYRVCLD